MLIANRRYSTCHLSAAHSPRRLVSWLSGTITSICVRLVPHRYTEFNKLIFHSIPLLHLLSSLQEILSPKAHTAVSPCSMCFVWNSPYRLCTRALPLHDPGLRCNSWYKSNAQPLAMRVLVHGLERRQAISHTLHIRQTYRLNLLALVAFPHSSSRLTRHGLPGPTLNRVRRCRLGQRRSLLLVESGVVESISRRSPRRVQQSPATAAGTRRWGSGAESWKGNDVIECVSTVDDAEGLALHRVHDGRM